MAKPIGEYHQLSLAVKFISVLFPFDVAQFLRTLSQEGYMFPESIGPVPLQGRLEGNITMGKGDILTRINTERQVLVVHASDVETVLSEMNSIETLLADGFGLNSPKLAHYYEFLAVLSVKAAKKNPLESWHTHFAHVPIVDKFSKTLGMDVSPFGIRLAKSEEIPNQTDWSEFRIEPSVQSATTHHRVEVVFRRSHRDEVFDFAEKFENTLRTLLSLVEQG